ncbi:MAG TPA: glycosyltransferase [Acidimicrobiia bacterium]|nr:glycosyltransferase [Acidimicrobiia bacterium]
MTGRVVFVTTELEPLTAGGAGVVVARLAARLADAGRAVTVVLVGGTGEAPGAYELVAVPVEEESPASRSRAAAASLAALGLRAGDRVEIQDFEGLGYHAILDRDHLGLDTVTLTVRAHGPTDRLLTSIGLDPPEFALQRAMERAALGMADAVVVPSAGFGDDLGRAYGLDPARVVVGPPPFEPLHARPYDATDPPLVVCYGRLAEVKGQVDLMRAAIPVLRDIPGMRLRFLHRDGWHIAQNRAMSEVLGDEIPGDVADRVEMIEADRDELAESVAGASLAVVPSRFESFCLAAHELRSIGLPLLVADLPAYADHLDESTGAVHYDGSVEGLQAVLQELLMDRGRLGRLAAAPPPVVGDPVAVYGAGLPGPRPAPARQALATRAENLVSAAVPAPEPPRRPIQRLMRLIPRPLARIAVAVLPGWLKERFRSLADWRVEEMRRTASDRRARIRSAIAAGRFPELDDPRVSIVIPCFNQGEYLDEAIQSVFEQTMNDFEIVVVDDGSTEPSTRAALGALDWPRLRVIRQANRGLPGARNAGIEAARGRFVVPLDADDALEPAFLESLVGVLEESPAAAYAHCWGRYFDHMDAFWITRPFNPYQLLLSNSVLGCVVLRRDAWRQVDGYDETLVEGNEDWDLWLRLLEAGWDQVQVRRPLFRYRIHGNTMSVDTLSRLEHARTELRRRHPALYDRAAVTKATHWPWVTVVHRERAPHGQDLDDREDVAAFGDTASILRSTTGKIVVEWDAFTDPPADVLRLVATALETHPRAATATVEGTPVAWRRWALLDPDAPLPDSVEVGAKIDAAFEPTLWRGMLPTPGWASPEDLPEPELEVIRQPPEEDGPLPAWISNEPGSR